MDISRYDFFQNNQNLKFKQRPLIVPIERAWGMKKDLLLRYYWGQIKEQKNQLTREIGASALGYLAELGEGVKSEEPIRVCFLVNRDDFSQAVHNVIILRAGSEAKIEVECGSQSCKGARHLSLTEIYLEAGAKLDLKMRHFWDSSTVVNPITLAQIGEAAEFNYQYDCALPPKEIISSPKIEMLGKGAKFQGINKMVSRTGAKIKLGNRVVMHQEDQSTRLTTKIVSYGGVAENYDEIVGKKKSQGHIECDGLLLSDEGSVASVPSIVAKSMQSELSHEASIGKLNPEQLEYLMTRGLSEEQAVKLIVSGFLA